MPVRVFFRGLILFRFPPTDAKDGGKVVAQLISEPTGGSGAAAATAARPRPHDHDSTIQIITGEEHVPPRKLQFGDTVEISVPGTGAAVKSPSFERHVPKLSTVAARSCDPVLHTINAEALVPDPHYVRCTVIVNRGTIRVKDVVIWDEGGFPLAGDASAGLMTSSPAELKFMGCDVWGHMANECVVEIPDATEVRIASKDSQLSGPYRSIGAPNAHTSDNALEILVRNFEFQRERPVPWGLDFQWLFKAAGYPEVDLIGPEFSAFEVFADGYHSRLYVVDRATLLPRFPKGLPFPYLAHTPLTSLRPLTEIDSRPVCVPAEG